MAPPGVKSYISSLHDRDRKNNKQRNNTTHNIRNKKKKRTEKIELIQHRFNPPCLFVTHMYADDLEHNTASAERNNVQKIYIEKISLIRSSIIIITIIIL